MKENNVLQFNSQIIRGNRKPFDKSFVFNSYGELEQSLNGNSNIYGGLFTSVNNINNISDNGPYYIEELPDTGEYKAHKILLTNTKCDEINYTYISCLNLTELDNVENFKTYEAKYIKFNINTLENFQNSIITDLQFSLYKPDIEQHNFGSSDTLGSTDVILEGMDDEDTKIYFKLFINDGNNKKCIATSSDYIDWNDPKTYIQTKLDGIYISKPINFIYNENIDNNKLNDDFYIVSVDESNLSLNQWNIDNFKSIYYTTCIDSDISTLHNSNDDLGIAVFPNIIIKYKNDNNLTTVNLVLNRQNQVIDYLLYENQLMRSMVNSINQNPIEISMDKNGYPISCKLTNKNGLLSIESNKWEDNSFYWIPDNIIICCLGSKIKMSESDLINRHLYNIDEYGFDNIYVENDETIYTIYDQLMSSSVITKNGTVELEIDEKSKKYYKFNNYTGNYEIEFNFSKDSEITSYINSYMLFKVKEDDGIYNDILTVKKDIILLPNEQKLYLYKEQTNQELDKDNSGNYIYKMNIIDNGMIGFKSEYYNSNQEIYINSKTLYDEDLNLIDNNSYYARNDTTYYINVIAYKDNFNPGIQNYESHYIDFIEYPYGNNMGISKRVNVMVTKKQIGINFYKDKNKTNKLTNYLPIGSGLNFKLYMNLNNNDMPIENGQTKEIKIKITILNPLVLSFVSDSQQPYIQIDSNNPAVATITIPSLDINDKRVFELNLQTGTINNGGSYINFEILTEDISKYYEISSNLRVSSEYQYYFGPASSEPTSKDRLTLLSATPITSLQMPSGNNLGEYELIYPASWGTPILSPDGIFTFGDDWTDNLSNSLKSEYKSIGWDFNIIRNLEGKKLNIVWH